MYFMFAFEKVMKRFLFHFHLYYLVSDWTICVFLNPVAERKIHRMYLWSCYTFNHFQLSVHTCLYTHYSILMTSERTCHFQIQKMLTQKTQLDFHPWFWSDDAHYLKQSLTEDKRLPGFKLEVSSLSMHRKEIVNLLQNSVSTTHRHFSTNATSQTLPSEKTPMTEFACYINCSLFNLSISVEKLTATSYQKPRVPSFIYSNESKDLYGQYCHNWQIMVLSKERYGMAISMHGEWTYTLQILATGEKNDSWYTLYTQAHSQAMEYQSKPFQAWSLMSHTYQVRVK